MAGRMIVRGMIWFRASGITTIALCAFSASKTDTHIGRTIGGLFCCAMRVMKHLPRSNKSAAGNRHRAFSFDGTMKLEYHHCSQRQVPVAVAELWR